MKKIYLFIPLFLLIILVFALFFVEIPSPSKKITEEYNLELK